MKTVISAVIFAAGAAFATTSFAQAPAGATALCKDGTYFKGATKQGACSGHQGIKDWYGDAPAKPADKKEATKDAPKEAAPTTAAPKTGATPPPMATPKPATPAPAAPAPAPTASPKAPATPAATAPMAAPEPSAKPGAATAKPTAAPAAAGAPGQVWVNTSSKVYHCAGTRWYGKTKQGEYMSEADAKAKGFTADHKKSCA